MQAVLFLLKEGYGLVIIGQVSLSFENVVSKNEITI